MGKNPCRGVAQPGSAPALGAGCRRFKSSRPDHSAKGINVRAVIQRVDFSSVDVAGRGKVSRTGRGLLALLGVERGDQQTDADSLLDKMIHLRIFEDAEGKMNLSLLDIGGDLMVVSQFTLLADCRKGRRPSFTEAAEPGVARSLYDYFVQKATLQVGTVGTGEFQAAMKVALVNDGPVTIILDSRKTAGLDK